jgi:hypothetical protein
MIEQAYSQDLRQEEDVPSTITEGCSNLEPGSQHSDYAIHQAVSSPVIFEGQSRISSISPIIAGHDEMAQDVCHTHAATPDAPVLLAPIPTFWIKSDVPDLLRHLGSIPTSRIYSDASDSFRRSGLISDVSELTL